MNLLVSCIMPTRNRPDLAAWAIRCFLEQDWPAKELVIVDDADAPSLLDANERIHPLIQYHLMNRRLNIGAKRNIAISRAQGDVILHWDDDDWYAPGYISDQVNRLLITNAPLVGYHSAIFVDEERQRAWKYDGSRVFAQGNYAIGASLCYRREFWKLHGFPANLVAGEDNWLVEKAKHQLISVDAREMMFVRNHRQNVCPRTLEATEYSEMPIPAFVQAVLGEK